MNNEKTVYDDSEETVVDKTDNTNEETVTDTPADNNEKKADDENTATQGQDKPNKKNTGKRVAVTAAAVGATVSAAATGAYFAVTQDDGNTEEQATEEPHDDDTVEIAASAAAPQPAQAAQSEIGSQPVNAHVHHEPVVETEPVTQPVHEAVPEQQAQTSEPTSEPVQEPEVTSEPEVEILNVEVVETENGEVTLGGMTVNGEDYVLVDVDGGNFDLAWHDDNHDQQVQDSELIDISEANISVEAFAQAAGQGSIDDTTGQENIYIANNNMDPANTGEIDYLDTSDTSGLV